MGPEGGRRPSAGGVLCGLTAAVVAKVLLLALNLAGGILACSLIGAPPPGAPSPSPPPLPRSGVPSIRGGAPRSAQGERGAADGHPRRHSRRVFV